MGKRNVRWVLSSDYLTKAQILLSINEIRINSDEEIIMFNIKSLNTSFVALCTSLALLTGASNSFAQEATPVPITVVDPATGRIIEAPKHFSQMSDEEKAAYNEADLKLLEEYEAKMKESTMTPKPQY